MILRASLKTIFRVVRRGLPGALLLLGVLVMPNSASAQSAAGKKLEPPQANAFAVAVLADRVRIRWDLPLVYPPGGYVIYRDGERLTPAPLRPVKRVGEPKQESDRPEDIVAAYLRFIENPAAVPEKDRARTAANLNAFVLLRSIDALEIARDLAILYDDTTARPGAQYIYRLVSLDAAGRETLLDTKTVRVVPTPPPTPPSNVTAENTELHGIGIQWKSVPSRAPTDPAGYNVYRSLAPAGPYTRINRTLVLMLTIKDPTGKVSTPEYSLYDEQLEDGAVVTYRVTGVDFFGRESAPVESKPVEYVDLRPPLPVEKVAARTTPGSVTLSWTLPEKGRIAAIEVTRSESIEGPFEPVGAPLAATATTATDSAVLTGRKYFYRVDTRSRRNKTSAAPRTVIAEVVNTAPPAAPRNLKAAARVGQVELTWDANAEADLAGYRVYRSGEERGDFALVSDELHAGLRYVDPVAAVQRNRFWYRLTAVNTSQMESEPSAAVSVEPPSNAPPRTPALRIGPATEGKIILEWERDPDGFTTGYYLYRAALPNDEMERLNPTPLPATPTRYEDSDVEPDHPYYYALEAVEKNGLISMRSATVTAATFLVSPAPAPTDLRAEFYVRGEPLGVTLSWKIPENARLRCVVLRSESPESGFVRVSSPLFEGQSRYTDSSVSVGKSYYYVIRATSPSGAVSPNSAVLKVTVPPPPKTAKP